LIDATYRLKLANEIRTTVRELVATSPENDALRQIDEAISVAEVNINAIRTTITALFDPATINQMETTLVARDIAAIKADIFKLSDVHLSELEMNFECESPAIHDQITEASKILDFKNKLTSAVADKANNLDILETDPGALTNINNVLEEGKQQLVAARGKLNRDVLRNVIANISINIVQAAERNAPAYLPIKKDLNALESALELLAEITHGDDIVSTEIYVAARKARNEALAAFIPIEVNFYLTKVATVETLNSRLVAITHSTPGALKKLTAIGQELTFAREAWVKAHSSLEKAKELGVSDSNLVDEEAPFVASLRALVTSARENLDGIEGLVKPKIIALKEKINEIALNGPEFLTDSEPFKRALLIEKNSALRFTDAVIRRENVSNFNKLSGLPLTAEVSDNATSLAFSNVPSDVFFQNVKLREGDVVRSHITFDRPPTASGPTPPAVCLLKQDHTAKVTNMSNMTKLSEEEKSLVALKQAHMLMNNYTPSSGNIIIRGRNPEMANKVYAALLLLKISNNKFKNADIKSYVVGCTGPTILTRNSSFIETHLGASTTEAMRATLSKDTATFTDIRYARLKDMNSFYKRTPELSIDYDLNDGDEIDLNGSVTPRA